jgi:hypothetical protein
MDTRTVALPVNGRARDSGVEDGATATLELGSVIHPLEGVSVGGSSNRRSTVAPEAGSPVVISTVPPSPKELVNDSPLMLTGVDSVGALGDPPLDPPHPTI